jgi:hypothetical protein
MGELERACDAVLRGALPAGLAVVIRRLLERGESAEAVLEACRRAGATRGTMTGLAVEAEIEAVAAELKTRQN